MKILNFGSLNIDYVYGVEHFVRPGETISSTSFQKFCGGKGLNQSIALARSGATIYHAGAVGESDGEILLETLQRNNIDLSFVKKEDCSSGHAFIQVNPQGQNCIVICGGSNQTIDNDFVDKVLENFEEGDFIVLQNEINNVPYIMAKAHEKRLKIVLNPSPMNSRIMELPLEYVNYFVLNELEAEDICGISDKKSLLDALCEKYPTAHIVLTLGKLGAEYKYGDLKLKHGIYSVPVVDTTAAGDTFTGFFIGSLSLGKSEAEALRLASVASSISVSRQGAEPSIPWMSEVESSTLLPIISEK